MSGPEYPPGPAPGSNAIGSFAIGVSQIGTIDRIARFKAVVSQYANSYRLTSLINSFRDAVDPTGLIDEFFDDVFNVLTAKGYGLDVWGRIVDVRRYLPIVRTTKNFGFAEGGADSYAPFNTWFPALNDFFGFQESGTGRCFGEAPLYSGQAPPPLAGYQGGGTFNAGNFVTRNFRLDDATYRRLIVAKMFANVSDGSVRSLNRMLTMMFPGRGNAYVSEGRRGKYFGFAESQTANGFGQQPFYLDQSPPHSFFGFAEAGSWSGFGQASFFVQLPFNGMFMTLNFDFPLEPIDVAIIEESGVIPIPAGVQSTVVQRY